MKRFLSVFLAAVMVCSTGFTAFAQEAVPEEEILFAEAAEDVQVAEVTEDVQVPADAEDVQEAAPEAEEPTDVPAEGIVEEVLAEDAEDEVGAIAPVYRYRVYLPQDYSEAQKYPTVYLMPYDGYSADQYFTDGIESVLDEITGRRGAYGDMVLGDLIPYVDGKYRTIDDERYPYRWPLSFPSAIRSAVT